MGGGKWNIYIQVNMVNVFVIHNYGSDIERFYKNEFLLTISFFCFKAVQFAEDRKLVVAPLLAHAVLHSSQGQKNFFDLLHFSPLKVAHKLVVTSNKAHCAKKYNRL